MKKFIAGVAVVLSLATAFQSNAQDGDRMARMKERQKQLLKDSVQLSDEKIEKVLAVQDEFRPKQREIFMDQSLDQAAKEAKLKALQEEQKKKLKGVLTDEEAAKLEAFQERNRGRMGPGGGRGGRGGGGGRPGGQGGNGSGAPTQN